MSNQEEKSQDAFGFLTVVRNPQHGLFGGYLVLNRLGRPMEFHCTAPIKPNRAQEILYGPTLEAFLYGEQIGQTLLKQGTAKPDIIFTDQEPALSVRDYVERIVALVLPSDDETVTLQSEKKNYRIDRAHRGGPSLFTFELGRNRLALPAKADGQRLMICERFGEMAESFDFAEPFQRIREAIDEAQQAVR